MPTLIKLTQQVVARAGDYLLIDKTTVKVVNGPEFEALIDQKMEQTPNNAKRPRREKRELDTEAQLILRFVRELPGIRSGDLKELLAAEGITGGHGRVAKRLELLSKTGHIKRTPIGGSPKHTLWEYHPLEQTK